MVHRDVSKQVHDGMAIRVLPCQGFGKMVRRHNGNNYIKGGFSDIYIYIYISLLKGDYFVNFSKSSPHMATAENNK